MCGLQAGLELLDHWLPSLQRMGIQPGLARIRALLERLGHPEQHFPVVLVGGTNGKGSVARALAAALGSGGVRVGCYTSPHLKSFNERIETAGLAAPPSRLELLLHDNRPHAEAAGTSYFETVTALALLYFARTNVDLAVLEVGLGGRFDATNAAEPILSIITQISLDHTEILGSSLESIAQEKAGILRPGVPLLTAAEGAALELIEGEAARLEAPVYALNKAFSVHQVHTDPGGLRFELETSEDRITLFSPLLGAHQVKNLSLAAVAAHNLGTSWPDIQTTLADFRHAGRLELIPEHNLLLDGAHNPGGARALAHALNDYFPNRARVLVLALSKDKPVEQMAKALIPAGFASVILTRYASPRSQNPETLSAFFPGAKVAHNIRKALTLAQSNVPEGGLVVVAGSLYLVGEVKRLLSGLPAEERWQ